MFATRTDANGAETAITEAVVREFATRTRFRVTTDAGVDSDAVLHGVILKQTTTPLTYNAATQQSSSFIITIVASVTLTARDGRTLYQNKNYIFRQQYQSTTNLPTFFARRPGSHAAALAQVCAPACGRRAGRVLSDNPAKYSTTRQPPERTPLIS